MQSGSARTPLAESMLTDNEITASEALAILGSETSREVVSANSKVADSTAVVPETQNPLLHAEAEVTGIISGYPHLTSNAGTSNLTVNATGSVTSNPTAGTTIPDLTVAPNAPVNPARPHALGTRPQKPPRQGDDDDNDFENENENENDATVGSKSDSDDDMLCDKNATDDNDITNVIGNENRGNTDKCDRSGNVNNTLTYYKIKLDGKTHCVRSCLLYTSPSPRDGLLSRMPSSA